MHSEHLESAISAAVNGDAVCIFSESWERALLTANAAEERAPEEWVQRISRRNGDRYIDFKTGGTLHFIPINGAGHRGLSLDRAFVPIGTNAEKLSDIVPALATSPRGYLTGY